MPCLRLMGFLKRYEKEKCLGPGFTEKTGQSGYRAKKQQEVCGNLLVILNHLEGLRDDWKGYVQRSIKYVVGIVLSAEQRKEFESVFTGEVLETAGWFICIDLLLRAVYDEQAYGKLKFAVEVVF